MKTNENRLQQKPVHDEIELIDKRALANITGGEDPPPPPPPPPPPGDGGLG